MKNKFSQLTLFLCIIMSCQIQGQEQAYQIDQYLSRIEILNVPDKMWLLEAIRVFREDTVHWPKTYFTDTYHITNDGYQIDIHNLKTKRSYTKINNKFNDIRASTDNSNWHELDDTYEMQASGILDTIDNYPCQEFLLIHKKYDTTRVWITEELPYLRLYNNFPVQMNGYIMKHETQWNPYVKKNDVRIVLPVKKVTLPDNILESIRMIESGKVDIAQPSKDACPPDSIYKELPEIPLAIAQSLNEENYLWQTTYKPPLYKLLELKYLKGNISYFADKKFDKIKYSYKQNKKKILLTKTGSSRWSKKYTVDIKFDRNGQVQKITDSLDTYSIHGDTLKRKLKSLEKYDIHIHEWISYNPNKNIMVHHLPRRIQGGRKPKASKRKKFEIYHFNSDSTVHLYGESVVPLSTHLSHANECKKQYQFEYDNNKQLLSIFDIKANRVEYQICYYNNYLIRSIYSRKQEENMGHGYRYYDYEIKHLDNQQIKISSTEIWQPPMPSYTTDDYIFDEKANIIYHRHFSDKEENATHYTIKYK